MEAAREYLKHETKWTIRRYKNGGAFALGIPTPVLDPSGKELPAVSEFHGNALLNEGGAWASKPETVEPAAGVAGKPAR